VNPKTTTLAVAALSILLSAVPGRAQERWSFEARVGGGVPTQDLLDDLGAGFGLDGSFGYHFVPRIAAYAGWGWMHFGVDRSFAGAHVDYEETAYTFGLRLEPFPSTAGAGAYWLRVGGVYGHVELEDFDGDRFADTGHGLGWEAGAGAGVDLRGVHLTPGVRFRALTREVSFEDVTTDVDLRYVALEVGVRWPI